jgi:hypothetical protein
MMIIMMTLLGFLGRRILIIVIEVALACPDRLEHLSESESRFDVSQQALRVWVRLKRSIRLFHLGKRGRVAGYLRFRSCLGDCLRSQIYRGVQIVLGYAHADRGIYVFFLAVMLPFSIHWKSSINEFCETTLLQVKRSAVFREHFKVAKQII